MRPVTTILARLLLTLLAACSSHKLPSQARPVVLQTARGPFSVSVYDDEVPPKSLALLASGDGGWSDLEEKMSRTLAAQGLCVIGWDCRNYAKLGPYDRKRLCEDVRSALTEAEKSTGRNSLPVLFVGFSTGAEQMISVAASDTRPSALRGLLVLAPGHRGRYGIELSDLMGIQPKGPNTFSLEEMVPSLTGLRIFQIHGEHDPLSQTSWLDKLHTEHRLEVYPDGWHLFRGGPPDFLDLVARGASWVLHD